MKIRLLLPVLFSILQLSATAQTFIDCSNGRYDTEIFSNVTVTSSVLYGSNTSYTGTVTQLTLDIYQPTGDTAAFRPLIVWAHGGSFVTGTKQDPDMVALCNNFAKRGYVCASIDYRLGIPFPPDQAGAKRALYRAVQDMKAAVRFFRKDAATANAYRIDPGLVFIGGSSAGAFTALHHAYLDDPSELPVEIDTVALGGMEGNSGNPGYSSAVNAVVNLCGALGDKQWIHPNDEPLCSMHGTTDQTVPYATATIYLFNVYPLMVVDGSYSVNQYADQIGLPNGMYTYFGAGHVPYLSNAAYMDTTTRFVSNFLYARLGCQPADPNPYPNTFNSSTGVAPAASVSDVALFPQPAAGQLFIRSSEKLMSVEMLDMSGRSLINRNVDDAYAFTIGIESLASGTYILRLHTEKGVLVRKAVKE